MTRSHRVPFRAPLGCDSLSDLPVFNDLDGLEEPGVFQDAPQGRPQRGGALLTTSRQGACRHMTSMVDADRGRPAQASLAGVSTVLPPPPTVLWKEVTVPTPHPRRGAPLSEDGTAAEPRGSSWFPSPSLVYVRLAPGVFIYFMLWVVIQYCCFSVAEPALALALGSSSVGSAVPDMPVHGGCCGLFPSTSLPRAISCSCLRVSVPPGSLVPSPGNGIRDHDLGTDVIIAARLWLLLSPLS